MKLKKIISIIFLLATLLSIFWAYQIFADARDFASKIETSKNLFMLEHNGKIICGVAASPSEKNAEPAPLSQENITKIQIDGYQSFSSDYYKIFIFNDKVFQDLPAVIKTGNSTNMSRESFVSLFDAEDVFAAIAEDYAKQGKIPDTAQAKAYARENMIKTAPVNESTALKGLLFASVLQSVMGEQKGPAYLFLAIKEGKLKVYPETSFFSAIKMLPQSVIEQIANKAG